MRKEIRKIKKNLYNHVDVLSNQIGARHPLLYSKLKDAANYIESSFIQSPLTISRQNYEIDGRTFTNIIAERIGTNNSDDIFIIGAHYDTVEESPGADDNATGIAALLEMVRLFGDFQSQRSYRFVAFTLEEPPYYGTSGMGSQVYSRYCQEQNDKIMFMTSLEMLGYFVNKKNSQSYPQPQLMSKHPHKGNFISVVGEETDRSLVKKVSHTLKKHTAIPVEMLVAHRAVHGVNLSDHASFWQAGYRAIMVTDTAFYRNPHYHKSDDTIDTIHFNKFSDLVYGLAGTFKDFDKMEF